MNLGGNIARASSQLPLFYIPPRLNCKDNATARNAYGIAAQEIVCQVLRLDPIPIDGRCEVCFDAEKNGDFYEIKSCHKSGKIVVYDWRMEKEAAAGVPSYYAILIHKLRGARRDIYNEMLKAAIIVVTIPTVRVHAVARKQPLRRMLSLNAGARVIGKPLEPACAKWESASVHAPITKTEGEPMRHLSMLSEPEQLTHAASVQSKRNGYNRAGYNQGYRNVPLWDLLTPDNLLDYPGA